MRIPMALVAFVCFIYGSPEVQTVIPSKDGYAIMPVKWATFWCQEDELRYHIQGDEKEQSLPHHIRLRLQKEYEGITKPSELAQQSDIKKIIGPLNFMKEKKHTLWIFPVHFDEGGHAVVFIQRQDGTFHEGSYRLGLTGP